MTRLAFDNTHQASDQPTTSTASPSLNLANILHNPLILLNTAPYLPASSLVGLAAVNHSFHDLVYRTPGVFRHLDLTSLKAAHFDIDDIDHGGEIWRNVQLDENLTEDDFYSGPLRGVFASIRRHNILQDVQTLILDGLSVTSELCSEIINDPAYSVRILSIRDVKNLNQGKLRGALQYACRPSRPDNAPRLKALYVFGSKDSVPLPSPESPASPAAINNIRRPGSSISAEWNQKSQRALTSSLQCQGDAWWSEKGKVISKHISEEWVNCLLACEGIIAFDTVLCQGPRHFNSPAFGKLMSAPSITNPAIATFAIPECAICGKAPEGMTTPTSCSPDRLPLLSPPPLLSSTIRAATAPQQPWTAFAARCSDCLRERYCATCQTWWCEACYQSPSEASSSHLVHPFVVADDETTLTAHESAAADDGFPKIKPRISKSCWECGSNCSSCIEATQKICKKCCAGYCIIHNEGSDPTFCDWCVSRGRRLSRTNTATGSLVKGGFSPPDSHVDLMRLRLRENR